MRKTLGVCLLISLSLTLLLKSHTEELTYYEVLGVSHDSSLPKIKKTYFMLARLYHPDSYNQKHPNATDEEKKEAEEQFKRIVAAYEILSDEEKRSEYDWALWWQSLFDFARQVAGPFTFCTNQKIR